MTPSEAARTLVQVAEETVFPRLEEAREALRAAAEQIAHGTPSERPFRILLAGGTGVGKSTLLNALANETIAEVGERRPTTADFTAYLHVRDDDPWLHGRSDVRLVRHRRDSLEGKVVLDSPDADSACLDHRDMLEGALLLADLVVVVVTEEKYVSAQVLTLLGRYREGRHFAFVFNKLDHGVDRAVVDDFGGVIRDAGFGDSPLFALSARAAVESRDGRDPSSGDFVALERYVTDELDRARMAGMVRTNLAQRAGLAAKLVRGSLPEGWGSIGETWQQRCDESSVRSFSQLGSVVTRHVLSEDECTEIITAARGASLSGVFGLFSAITYGMRAMGPASQTRPGLLEAKLRARMDEVFGAVASDAVLREGFALEASRLGLNGSMVREMVTEHATHGTSQQVVAARLPARVRDELSRHSRPPGTWWNTVMNLPAWAWIGYWIGRTALRVLQGRAIEWEAFPGALVILLVAFALEWTVVHRLLTHRARRGARTLISSVLTGLEAEVVALHARAIEPALRRVREHVGSITQVLQALDDMARG